MATVRMAGSGWNKWTPVNAGAIAVHLIGVTGMLAANSARVRHQQAAGASSIAKASLTLAALGATAYARVLGKKVELATSPDPEDVEKAETVPVGLAQTQQQLTRVQWAIPALTAALVAVSALQGEQQRPSQQKKGMLQEALHRI